MRLAVLFSIPLALSSLAAQSQIDVDRELFVKHVGVVDNARAQTSGPWAFGTLMRRMAGNVPPSDFVTAWLDTWLTPQTVNGQTVFSQVKANAIAAFKAKWLQTSGGSSLNLDFAPFRLLGIVNRPDLLRVTPQIQQAAELRFVYGALDPVTGNKISFFVIFEYGVPAASCQDIVAWQQRWHALLAHSVGSEAYNRALQVLTDEVTRANPGSGRVNGSHLNQLRVNEIIPPTPFWDLREWNIVAPPNTPNLGTLRNVTTKQTPHLGMLSTLTERQRLARFLDANAPAILAGNHDIPARFENLPFLGGDAINDNTSHPQPPGRMPNPAAGTLWWAEPGYDGVAMTVTRTNVRHGFALQTCSGCHFFETGTDGGLTTPGNNFFVHVAHRDVGTQSRLSNFLTGIGNQVLDPVSPFARDAQGNLVRVQRQFHDLGRRALVMQRILNVTCSAGAIAELAAIQGELGSRVH